MDNTRDELTITSDELQTPQKSSKKQPKKQPNFFKKHKKPLIIVGIILAVAGIATAIFFIFFFHPEEAVEEARSESKPAVKYYSKLSGEEIADDSENSKPLYCMQIPNGLDVGDPRIQIGLHQAKIVFEAIAEAGITRFAAIFQNPQGSMLGPIRSMRSYYLAWDTPFNCTLVHAGGSDDALQSIQDGHYRDLSENYSYMWRDYTAYVAPNNLFTSPGLLNQFNSDYGYNTSDFTAFPRLKPEEAKAETDKLTATDEKSATSDQQNTTTNQDESNKNTTPKPTPVNNIIVRFGGNSYFNPTYAYDAATNTYHRGWEYGASHTSYDCPAGLEQPSPRANCTEVQLAPSAVAVIKVDQWLDTDGYHQVLDVTDSGQAYIFQNGTVIEGTWSKADIPSQIEFKDKQGNTIKFTPGQLWISAIPNSTGSIDF